MRKIYSMVAFAAMSLMSLTANAQTMTDENPTLDQLGYRIERDVNFVDGLYRIGEPTDENGVAVPFSEITPNDGLHFGASEDYKINKYTPQKVTNEGLEFLSIQIPGNGIAWENGTGLRSTSNERWIIVNGLRVGQILAVEVSNADTTQFVVNSISVNTSDWSDNFCDPLVVEPISGSIHELQELGGGEIDTYRYFKVINEGYLPIKFNGKSPNNTLYRMQIWTDKDDDEAISTPVLKVVGVDNDAREIEFKPGVSTKGAKVETYYSIDGSDPIFLIESDEIDHWEYVYEEDGEGNLVVTDSTAVYKKVLDRETVEQLGGAFGDYLYNLEDGSIYVSANDDEDGDGIITVKAASVSVESGLVSDIVTIEVGVGIIPLNKPTLALVGIDGEKRAYQIGWTNNTLCGEDYVFTLESGDDYFEELEPNAGVGATISSSSSITVTVSVKGYEDGVARLDSVAAYGIDMRKKGVGNGMSDVHGWDFQNLTQEVLDKINGTVDHYALLDEDGNEVEVFTVEQYEEGEVPEGVVEIYKRWGWDDLDTRQAGRHWRTWIQDFEYVDNEEGGVDTLLVGTHYADDETGLFVGLDVDNSHPNYSTLAIFTNANGLYFMGSTNTVVVKDVEYGEYVMISTNNGTSVEQCSAAEGGCTLSIKNGTYLYSIDVFTYDNLPDAIESVDASATSAKAAAFYSINGARLAAPQKGINLVKYSDGSVKKILVK